MAIGGWLLAKKANLTADSQQYANLEVLGTAPSVHGPHFRHLVHGATTASDAGV